jgi:DNA-binding NarL/FixJ family response regulator
LYSSASELIEIGASDDIDLVILCLNQGDVGRAECCELVHRLATAIHDRPIIIISDEDDARAIADVLRWGVRGYIPTSLDPAVAIAALNVVLAGGTFAPATAFQTDGHALDGRNSQPDEAERKQDLERARIAAGEDIGITPREVAVLACLLRGRSNKLIARELNMSEGTVKVHVRHLMWKLQASNRTQLAVLAQRALENGVNGA